MKTSEASASFAPFGALVNRHALSENYKSLLLAPGFVRGMSAFGVMETEIPLGIVGEVAVEGEAFLQILRSLPSADLELHTSDNTLQWKAGAAKGRLALVSSKVSIPTPPWPEGLVLHEIGANFVRGLDLGSVACGTTALMSLGLFGIHVVNANGSMIAYTSDNTTMSRARVGDEVPGAASFMTLTPDALRLISVLAGRGKMSIQFDETSVWCQTPDTKLVIKQTTPIKVPLRDSIDNFLGEEVKVELNRDIISSFIRRVDALAEDRGKANVTISVEEGAVRLFFEESRASQEEYYLADGGVKVNVAPVVVDARRFGRVLANATHVVFDYADKGALVLRGSLDFAFIISAIAPSAKVS